MAKDRDIVTTEEN